MTYAAALAASGAASQDLLRNIPALTGINIARISPTTLCEADTRLWVQQCAWFAEVIAGVGVLVGCVILHLTPYAMVPFISAAIIIDGDDWTYSEPCMYI
jgi:hypothetical protein